MTKSKEAWESIASAAGKPLAPTVTRPQSTSREWLRWSVSFATAAAVMMMLFAGWQLRQPRPVDPIAASWGWARGLPDESEAAEYLDLLAKQAEEWNAERPATSGTLVRRLAEFRQGCGSVLTATHPQLNDAQRVDLWESCRKWSASLDELIARAQLGEDPLLIRNDTDALVTKLTQALRGRITRLQSG